MNLKDKVVLVSGAGQGIGAAVARRFYAEGAIVGLSDVAIEPVAALSDELNNAGKQRALPIALDVTDPKHWESAVTQLTAEFGGLDILINNAGIYELKLPDDIDEHAWDLMMAVNAKGPFLGCRIAMAAMRERGGGAIVNVSSMAGISGSRSAHYAASKGAVRLMTKSVALVGAPDNIRCNSVHPGMVETQMGETATREPGSKQGRLARLPLGRFATPDEIANVIVFLASEQASFMTGAEIAVDGGAALA